MSSGPRQGFLATLFPGLQPPHAERRLAHMLLEGGKVAHRGRHGQRRQEPHLGERVDGAPLSLGSVRQVPRLIERLRAALDQRQHAVEGGVDAP